jgi:NitT/TauT family transport system ATP-binding protein
MVFQHFGLLPWKTVYDNAAFGLRMADADERTVAERVGQYLQLVGLRGFEKSFPHQLSGGMQQRVAIARALAYRPEILIMDEPFASVDAQTRFELEDLCLKIRDDFGMTILLVTHDIDEAVYLSDRVLVLGNKPTQVVDLIETHLGTDRDQITTKATPEFTQLRSRVYQEIRHGDIPSSTGSVTTSTRLA